ncbi:GNAT family N-acetyltransferase [Pseudogemmobacter sp. W21_MBD1_M6]|uniref:GNAT family N-acetyltransferase n=1 Tax=Pseudogemmobacter sp. W21_MBD1_M6 TaxID=3240271 RepID=UPI003F954FB8
MPTDNPQFLVRLARTPEDVTGAQRLRYRVFVSELGGDGPMVDHAAGLERDSFDAHCDHLVLIDSTRAAPEHVVGAYRLMRTEQAEKAGRFYSEAEYDLAPLKSSGRTLLELGRSCLDADYRGGMAMHHLWQALAAYVLDHRIEVLFGVASFHGTDIDSLAGPLSLLHARHLAPKALRVRVRDGHFQRMDLMPEEAIDRPAAMKATPALIKAYLRLGGCVGEGAFVDHAFNTTDVCLVMDTEQMNARQRDIYTKARTP